MKWKSYAQRISRALWWVIPIGVIIISLLEFFRVIPWFSEPSNQLAILTSIVGFIALVMALERGSILDEILNRLDMPKVLLLHNARETHQAAAELLERVQEGKSRRELPEVILTHLETSPWQPHVDFPERQKYKRAKADLIRRGEIPIRQIFIIPDSVALEDLQKEMNEFQGCPNFQIKAFAHGGDLPHIDMLAVRGIGALITFPHSLAAKWDAMGIRVDDPWLAEMIFQYFEFLWDHKDGFLLFSKGQIQERQLKKLRKVQRYVSSHYRPASDL